MQQQMRDIEVYDSWSKVRSKQGLIARKKVDKSFIKQGGSGIPQELYSTFPSITKITEEQPVVEIKLIYKGMECRGNVLRKASGRVWINIKEEHIRKELATVFQKSARYIEEQEPKIETTKKFIVIPDNEAEYVEFYKTNQEDTYEMKFITQGDEVVECELRETGMDIYLVANNLRKQGFCYSFSMLSNFYLSLKTKPFTILAGISGTGKSKLVRLFAEAIGAEFELIPVRPDWSDATDLLGYRDLNQNFHKGRFIKIIERAQADLSKPYVVCLDEMNLARVEYYFSDFLSLIESRRRNGSEIVTDCFVGTDLANFYIPENLYIVGTVNMDETTFQFSKKVLDRANTIELSEIDLDYDFEKMGEEEVQPLAVYNEVLKSKYLVLQECAAHKKEVKEIISQLIMINEFLKPCGLQFAYRVRDEIIFYMLYNREFELLDVAEAFDYQLLQKILPRMSGTSSRIREVLVKLACYCIQVNYSASEFYEVEELEEHISEAVYPKSFKKIIDMLRRYDEDGFTSFWF